MAILKDSPKHSDALYNLGAIYANLGDSGQARKYWGELLLLDPKSESGARARTMLARLPDGAK